jgi:hypothetical protein
MNTSIATKIKTLRLYLSLLPKSLPLPSADGGIYQFQHFNLDNDWVADIGEEGAVNRELEVRLGSRQKGLIQLKERGTGICGLANVLEEYLRKYPTSVILEKWLSDVMNSVQLAYETAGVQVSDGRYNNK